MKQKAKPAKRKADKRSIDYERRNQHTPTAMQTAMLVKVISTGNHFSVACRASGVSWDKFQHWLDLGRRGHPGYAKFLAAIEKAEAESERLGVDIVMEAARNGLKRTRSESGPDGLVEVEEYAPDWRAAAWLLEHRFGERFAAMRKLQHGGALTHRQVVVVHDGDPELVREDWDKAGVLTESEDDGAQEDTAAGAGSAS